jgi:hypothetical protein
LDMACLKIFIGRGFRLSYRNMLPDPLIIVIIATLY